MYKILLLTRGDGKFDFRQTPGGKGIVGDGKYQYYVNEQLDDPDFVVVRGKGIRETRTFHVAPENTLLLTSEPYSVLSYPKGYCKQFGVVCSCQENLRLPNVIYTPAMLPWFVGVAREKEVRVTAKYEDIAEAKPEKTKLISVITSNKAFTQGHIDRLRFVEKLKERYGEMVEVFGAGFRPFEDKWDVLAPYKYHIAIENSASKYYWTEKISDCYLAGTYPIYYGCPNIFDYFPSNALSVIDIKNFEQAAETIDQVLAADTYAMRQGELQQCKNMVLKPYNMFEYVAKICSRLDASTPKKEVTLKPAQSYFDFHNLYLYTIGRNYYKLKNKIMSHTFKSL